MLIISDPTLIFYRDVSGIDIYPLFCLSMRVGKKHPESPEMDLWAFGDNRLLLLQFNPDLPEYQPFQLLNSCARKGIG